MSLREIEKLWVCIYVSVCVCLILWLKTMKLIYMSKHRNLKEHNAKHVRQVANVHIQELPNTCYVPALLYDLYYMND